MMAALVARAAGMHRRVMLRDIPSQLMMLALMVVDAGGGRRLAEMEVTGRFDVLTAGWCPLTSLAAARLSQAVAYIQSASPSVALYDFPLHGPVLAFNSIPT